MGPLVKYQCGECGGRPPKIVCWWKVPVLVFSVAAAAAVCGGRGDPTLLHHGAPSPRPIMTAPAPPSLPTFVRYSKPSPHSAIRRNFATLIVIRRHVLPEAAAAA